MLGQTRGQKLEEGITVPVVDHATPQTPTPSAPDPVRLERLERITQNLLNLMLTLDEKVTVLIERVQILEQIAAGTHE